MDNSKKNEIERLISILIIVVSLIASAVLVFYFLVLYDKKEEKQTSEAMPAIVGYTVSDVEGCYSRFFTLNIEEVYSDYAEGVILSQSIAENELYEPGNTVVNVTVSAGKKPEETAAPEETAEAVTEAAVTEPEREIGLLVDSPLFAFETAAAGEASTLITSGIDESAEGMSEALDALYSVLIKRYGDAGFIYVDLESGAWAEYNADESFSAASIIKAPYVRSVLGYESDLDKEFEMTEEMLNSTYELVNGEPVGTMFSVSELACAAIEKSDNTAYKMLYNYVGYDCFNQLAEALGNPQRMTDENYWFKLTPRQTAVYFKDIYFFNEQHENGGLMKEYLANSERNDLFADELTEYTVCEKYGYLPQDDFYTLGDAAIVYADSPYMIIGYIRSSSSSLNTQFFRDCARCADDIHKLIHS
ncbi:MAG: serine hydrolase [Oscillospiraceae bacterium]